MCTRLPVYGQYSCMLRLFVVLHELSCDAITVFILSVVINNHHVTTTVRHFVNIHSYEFGCSDHVTTRTNQVTYVIDSRVTVLMS